MRNQLMTKLLFVLVCMTGFMVSCQKEGYGDFSLSVKKVEADFVELFVTAPHNLEMAYIVTETAQLVSPEVLFATGNLVEVAPGQVLKITDGIWQDREYHVYAVARLDDDNFSEKVSLSFKTKKYQFDEMITIVETYYDGYKVHITVPQATKDRGNVIRAGAMPLAWYNLKVSQSSPEVIGMQAVASNGDPYKGHMFNDSTYVMNDLNVVEMDANGEPVIDELTQQMIDIHDPMVPGEPTIIFAGECRYGSPDDYANVVGYNQPERDSWSVPMYDRKTQTWTGEFQYKEFFTKEPALCEANVEVEIPEDEIGVTDAMIYFTPDADVHSYFYMVLDNMTYNQILSTYLAGHTEWYQWFLTSYIAFYEWGIYPVSEFVQINAAQNFTEPLTGGETYHVLVTVFGDEQGASQKFIHKEFKAKEKTKVAPVINVTAVESKDPYTATFNIKAGPDSKGNVQPIMGAYWACNYSNEFEKMFNAKYDYPSLLKNMGWTFTSAEIAEINSADGLTISFPTLDGEVTRMAVYGCNDEYTFNLINEETPAAWADYKAPMADKIPAVSSDLFTKLQGEWTATATLKAKMAVDEDNVVDYNTTHTSKITISATAPALPESLDKSVYDLYSDKSKDDVDGMFDELRELSDIFTEYRLQGQNRLLCCGFMDLDPEAPKNGVNRFEFRSPYDLFVASDYSSVDVPQLMYDFGPKWYLQVLEDGSVIVPFSSMTMPPMSNWTDLFYVSGVGNGTAFYDATELYPGFPVEISADFNTITIKPIVLSDGTQSQSYYMNALGIDQMTGSYEILATVLSDIVLTRGWTEPAKRSVAYAAPTSVEAVTIDGTPVLDMPTVAVMKSLTDFEVNELPSYKFVEKANVVTKDMVDATSAKILGIIGNN